MPLAYLCRGARNLMKIFYGALRSVFWYEDFPGCGFQDPYSGTFLKINPDHGLFFANSERKQTVTTAGARGFRSGTT